MPAGELFPLLLCADGFLVLKAGAMAARLVRFFSVSLHAAAPVRRLARSPAERFLPCRRLSIGIPRR